MEWRKSRRSGEEGGNCVELADLGADGVGLRDSKLPDDIHLTITRDTFRKLIETVRML
ncbi:DUF397 domain-containing protein [Actinomadura fulvescens]|uniref:DUF397 domain-containing protein n=1 Tax=Actinomadura fulvescens TaxID=46160 RepID=A0ABN3PSI4_9ACTN